MRRQDTKSLCKIVEDVNPFAWTPAQRTALEGLVDWARDLAEKSTKGDSTAAIHDDKIDSDMFFLEMDGIDLVDTPRGTKHHNWSLMASMESLGTPDDPWFMVSVNDGKLETPDFDKAIQYLKDNIPDKMG